MEFVGHHHGPRQFPLETLGQHCGQNFGLNLMVNLGVSSPRGNFVGMHGTLPNQFKLVYEPFGRINMHNTLDLCPRGSRKETNVPL